MGSSPANINIFHKITQKYEISVNFAIIIAYFNICANIQLKYIDLLKNFRQNNRTFLDKK
ncbi:hypothetical protein BV085_354 [Haemophilus influenzae]|nr:hypothetical protein BV083_356 [Haemophilus influenzae]AVI97199.1 hypothetical protein BV085_354 [Haemophilus influenzae]